MFAKIGSLGLSDLTPSLLTLEIDNQPANPQFDIVGLPDLVVRKAVNEYALHFVRAISNSLLLSVMVNLALCLN